MSEAELLSLKSKTSKGIPYHLSTKMNHKDYLKALNQTVDEIESIEYKINRKHQPVCYTDLKTKINLILNV